MTLQQRRRTESFVRKVTPGIVDKKFEEYVDDVYDVANNADTWDARYREEGEIYNNLMKLAPMLGIIGQAVPALNKDGKKAYIIGNLMDETSPKKLNRAIFQVRPKLLKKYLKDGHVFGREGDQISDIGDLKDVLYHLIGTQPASDFPEGDLSVFYPSKRYIGNDPHGQYSLLPSSSARKEYNDDGTLVENSQFKWWTPVRYDRRLISMTDPILIDQIKQRIRGGEGVDDFFAVNPGLDKEALTDAVTKMLQAETEDIGKHIPSEGAITGQATQNIYPAIFGLRTIAPYIPREKSPLVQLKDLRVKEAEAEMAKQQAIGEAVAEEGYAQDRAERMNRISRMRKKAISDPAVAAGIPGSGVVANPAKLKEGVKYTLGSGVFINEDGETEEEGTGEIVEDAPMVATRPYKRSAAEMFEKSLAARKSRKNVVTNDNGAVDVVKSSTSSLFDRMKRHR